MDYQDGLDAGKACARHDLRAFNHDRRSEAWKRGFSEGFRHEANVQRTCKKILERTQDLVREGFRMRNALHQASKDEQAKAKFHERRMPALRLAAQTLSWALGRADGEAGLDAWEKAAGRTQAEIDAALKTAVFLAQRRLDAKLSTGWNGKEAKVHSEENTVRQG